MFTARVLVVTDREEVAAELDPLIREQGHLSLAVADGDEAINLLEEGVVPDVVISDARARAVPGARRYLRRFRQLNQFGQHIRLEDGSTLPLVPGTDEEEPFVTLCWPLDAGEVRRSLARAIDQIRSDLQALRGEMFRETRRLQQAIRDAQLEMITALAVTMEAKDPYMQGHCARVAELAARTAAERGLDEDACDRLRTAALLHEIGKIGIPLELLHKTGTLTKDELGQIRSHTGVGAQIVSAIPSLSNLAPLIRTQYTNFADLATQISPESEDWMLAGILRVVDTYDAMTSDRSYRATLSQDVAFGELRRGAGLVFDPDAVAVFLRVAERLGDESSATSSVF